MPVLPLSGPLVNGPQALVAPEALTDAGPDTGPVALDLPNTADVAALAPHLGRVTLIRVDFPGFADGRGFSLARRLRQLGYRGRLRAAGHLLPDQRGALEGSGFDEVELSAELLARQGGAEVWAAARPLAPFLRRRQRPAAPEASAA